MSFLRKLFVKFGIVNSSKIFDKSGVKFGKFYIKLYENVELTFQKIKKNNL